MCNGVRAREHVQWSRESHQLGPLSLMLLSLATVGLQLDSEMQVRRGQCVECNLVDMAYQWLRPKAIAWFRSARIANACVTRPELQCLVKPDIE
eukprot:2409935-Alexandrium_andersonii.AAC.1